MVLRRELDFALGHNSHVTSGLLSGAVQDAAGSEIEIAGDLEFVAIRRLRVLGHKRYRYRGSDNANEGSRHSTRMNFRLTLVIFYYRVLAESFGAAGAMGSILKGISKVTDCGILQI